MTITRTSARAAQPRVFAGDPQDGDRSLGRRLEQPLDRSLGDPSSPSGPHLRAHGFDRSGQLITNGPPKILHLAAEAGPNLSPLEL